MVEVLTFHGRSSHLSWSKFSPLAPKRPINTGGSRLSYQVIYQVFYQVFYQGKIWRSKQLKTQKIINLTDDRLMSS